MESKPSSKQAMAALKLLLDEATDNAASQRDLRELRERVAVLEEANRQRERNEEVKAKAPSNPGSSTSDTLKTVAPWIAALIGLATILAQIVKALLP